MMMESLGVSLGVVACLSWITGVLLPVDAGRLTVQREAGFLVALALSPVALFALTLSSVEAHFIEVFLLYLALSIWVLILRLQRLKGKAIFSSFAIGFVVLVAVVMIVEFALLQAVQRPIFLAAVVIGCIAWIPDMIALLTDRSPWGVRPDLWRHLRFKERSRHDAVNLESLHQ